MKFKIYKMNFTSAVHFGEGGLATSSDVLMADSVFAALCTEAAAWGGGMLERLLDSAFSGRLLLSDGLPYIGETLYVPKPVMEVRGDGEVNSVIKKALKKLRYIPADKLDIYLQGKLDIAGEAKRFHDGCSHSALLEKVTVPEHEITRPYAVAVRRFRPGSGLYLCMGYGDDETCGIFTELMNSLSYAGIGGKRSAGYGRFELTEADMEESILKRLLKSDSEKYMSLSVCLPTDEELDDVISNADYLSVKRSGWIASGSYADSFRKKKDLYMLSAGSVFSGRFSGGIFDVGEGGGHPVYRYGKPMLLAVS